MSDGAGSRIFFLVRVILCELFDAIFALESNETHTRANDASVENEDGWVMQCSL